MFSKLVLAFIAVGVALFLIPFGVFFGDWLTYRDLQRRLKKERGG